MGYSTEFTGQLRFKNTVTNTHLGKLNSILGKDIRDLGYDNSIYENGKYGSYWYHIDLKITDDFSGIEWNKCEKTSELEHVVNWVSALMRIDSDFELEGEMHAQGEEYEDRWRLVMKDGLALKVEQPRI